MSIEAGRGEREEGPADGVLEPGRWLAAAGRTRQIVCIGDSTSRTVAGELTWVDLLAIHHGAPGDPKPAEGIRGIWRTREWSRQGSWRRTTSDDRFDAAPYGFGYVSSGDPTDQLTWTRPSGTPVAAFDLYTMSTSGLGRAQYRVDDGDWREVMGADPSGSVLVRTPVEGPVHRRVQVRAGDGATPCVVAVAGLDVYATRPDGPPRTRLHHLGIGKQQLQTFCRRSEGDPFALLHRIRPELVIVAVTNDVMWGAPAAWDATLRELVASVEPYADVVLLSSFEQRAPRKVDDAATSAGSDRVRSATAAFVASDATEVVWGTNIPSDPESTIVSVVSEREVVLSAPATGTGEGGELVVGWGRQVEMQAAYRATTRLVAAAMGCRHLDIYEAWSEAGATGWDEADDRGLMLDRNHATAEGHRDIADRLIEVLERPPPAPEGSVEPGTDPGSATEPLPVVIPGHGTVMASTSGTVELRVPVALSSASDRTVTVRWRTLLDEDADLQQAPHADYVAASGRVTFAPGQVEATVAITVIGNSTGHDEAVLVSFTDPTNAVVGGTWGLGGGTITALP